MTRVVVATEGKDFGLGTILAKGALKPGREPIPVTIGFDPADLIGRATGFERNEETGEVSYDVEIHERIPRSVEQYGKFTVSGDQVDMTRRDGVPHCVSARVRGIAVLPIPGFLTDLFKKE